MDSTEILTFNKYILNKFEVHKLFLTKIDPKTRPIRVLDGQGQGSTQMAKEFLLNSESKLVKNQRIRT